MLKVFDRHCYPSWWTTFTLSCFHSFTCSHCRCGWREPRPPGGRAWACRRSLLQLPRQEHQEGDWWWSNKIVEHICHPTWKRKWHWWQGCWEPLLLSFLRVLSEMGEMETADLDVEIVRLPCFSISRWEANNLETRDLVKFWHLTWNSHGKLVCQIGPVTISFKTIHI